MITAYQPTSNCTPNPSEGNNPGGKGTTLWFSEDITLSPFGGQWTWSFTDTKPCCYDDNPATGGTHICLIVYEIATTQDSTTGVMIERYLNGHDLGRTIHSAISGHNVTEAFDLVNSRCYISGQQNSVRFENDSDIPVQIKNFRIIRIYAIFGLNSQLPCNDPEDASATGNLDYTRQDYPCNYDNCGNRMSYIPYNNDTHVSTIAPTATASWQFQHPNTP